MVVGRWTSTTPVGSWRRDRRARGRPGQGGHRWTADRRAPRRRRSAWTCWPWPTPAAAGSRSTSPRPSRSATIQRRAPGSPTPIAHSRRTSDRTSTSRSRSPGAPLTQAGIETILAGAYASLALDLIDGPDNWYLAVATPTERGIICGALSAHDGSDDGPEHLLLAARYAASTAGRGMDRVGLATSGSLADLPWDAAATKVRRLGEAARLVTRGARGAPRGARPARRRHPIRGARPRRIAAPGASQGRSMTNMVSWVRVSQSTLIAGSDRFRAIAVRRRASMRDRLLGAIEMTPKAVVESRMSAVDAESIAASNHAGRRRALGMDRNG